MDEEAVRTVVRRTILEVLPDLNPTDVRLDGTLGDLGANSIDRADIVTLATEELGIVVPVAAFGAVHDIPSLVTTLQKYA